MYLFEVDGQNIFLQNLFLKKAIVKQLPFLTTYSIYSIWGTNSIIPTLPKNTLTFVLPTRFIQLLYFHFLFHSVSFLKPFFFHWWLHQTIMRLINLLKFIFKLKVKEQNSESYHNELNAFNCFESCLPLIEGNLTPKLRWELYTYRKSGQNLPCCLCITIINAPESQHWHLISPLEHHQEKYGIGHSKKFTP